MRYAALGFLLLALCTCHAESVKPFVFEGVQGDVRISGPYVHENLAVFLLHQDDAPQDDWDLMTLDEALEHGAVRLSEKDTGAEVNELQIENVSGRPVYLQAGDTVKGGQQDRAIAIDFVLPAHSGRQTISAFCVEPARWSYREPTADGVVNQGGLSLRYFTGTKTAMASREQKLATKLEKNQDKVWTAGRSIVRNMGARVQNVMVEDFLVDRFHSYVLATEDPDLEKRVSGYLAALAPIVRGKRDVIGMAFAINGKVNSGDIYAGAGLFRKLWSRLLRSCSLEAFCKKTEDAAAGAVTRDSVRAFLNEGSSSKGRTEHLSGDMNVKVYETKGSVRFDTQKGGKTLHRQHIRKD